MFNFFRKYHKWGGIFLMFFLLMFAISGVLLNHRSVISKLDIPRKWLPKEYSYKNWNNGVLVGTVKLSPDTILAYGGSGVWLTNPQGESFSQFNDGMSRGIDNQNIRNMVIMPNNSVFALNHFQLYQLNYRTHKWRDIANLVYDGEERMTDICTRGDSLIIMTRSHLYTSLPPYKTFTKTQLLAPKDYNAKVSLFRTFWLTHSGELFGIIGKIVVDVVGIITIILCITGILITILRFKLKIKKKRKKELEKTKRSWLFSLKWHNKFGYVFFVLLLFVVLTGMFLRPPLLIAIVRAKVKPVPGSMLDSPNAWNDKLRIIRYDNLEKEFIISTSEGFYTLKDLEKQPQKIAPTPPISVMGATVFAQSAVSRNKWLVGSFSGLYEWNFETSNGIDYYTGKPIVKRRPGRFSFGKPVSGFSSDFSIGDVIFEYNRGAIVVGDTTKQFVSMPEQLKDGKISLWNTSLELHVGRLYYNFMRGFTDFYIFFSGFFFMIILISGYVIYVKRHKKMKKKNRRTHNPKTK